MPWRGHGPVTSKAYEQHEYMWVATKADLHYWMSAHDAGGAIAACSKSTYSIDELSSFARGLF